MGWDKVLRYQDLNTFLDGFLGLAKPDVRPSEVRQQLIEEAASSEDVVELLEQWVLIHELSLKDLLKVKAFLQFDYAQLAQVFYCHPREIAQQLKAQRSAQLPAYPTGDQVGPGDGLSCFMVEQYLSSWIDAEIHDVRMIQSVRSHLDQCSHCQGRLTLYRQLQGALLATRKPQAPVTEDEWILTLEHLRVRERRWLIKVLFYFVVAGALATLIVLFFVLRPERVPNIYELP